jgi:hypothetical protein
MGGRYTLQMHSGFETGTPTGIYSQVLHQLSYLATGDRTRLTATPAFMVST